MSVNNSHATKLLVLVLAAAACGVRSEPTSPRITQTETPLLAKPVQLSTVSLIVTVTNVDSLGRPYGIQGDGQGDYTDGTQNVRAAIDQYGTFAFNTNTSRKAAMRWVNYNFNNPADPSNTYRPSPSTTENFHFSTGASAFSAFTPIQNLGVNGNPQSECVYMGNSVSNASTTWRVSFHKGLEDTQTSPTAFAVVTRTSVSPAVWTITPVGSCSAASNVAALRSDDGSVLYGYYTIPFFMTVRAR